MDIQASDLISSQAHELLSSPEEAKAAQGEYRRMGVVQINDFFNTDSVLRLGESLYNELSPFYQVSEYHQEFIKLRGGGQVMTSGYRFGRIDPTFGRRNKQRREAINEAFNTLGFKKLGLALGKMLTPLVTHVIESDIEYKYIYCFIYREGDYIGPHNDAQTGDRVNVQLPIPMAAVTGFRALADDGRFRLYYDTPGCLRVLGPKVWHEVLPVLRLGDTTPRRLLISLRFS